MTDRPEDPSDPKVTDPEVPVAPGPEPEPEAVAEPEREPEPTDDEIDAEADEADDDAETAETAEADDDDDEADADQATEAVPGATTPTGGRRRGAAPVKPKPPTLSEIAVHVNEPWSKIFVIVVVAVFVAILLNGLLLGKGGLITATPQPTASVTASPPTSASPSP